MPQWLRSPCSRLALVERKERQSAKLTAWWGTDYVLLAKYDGRWMITHVLW